MAFDKALLDIVCCPVTHAPLEVMGAARLERLNAMIAERKIKTCNGELVTEPLHGALATRDGRLAYPVHDDIPVLLEDRGILLGQLDGQ